MLNHNTFISPEGLGHFRDRILVDSISQSDSFVAVPAGTTPKSYQIYYSKKEEPVGSGQYVYEVANPQPTTTISANTYYLISAGSPADVTRAPSVNALTSYVDGTINGEIIPAINNAVVSVDFSTSDGKISYTDGAGHTTKSTNAISTNTTGGDDTSSKIFLVGMTAQTTSNGTSRTYTQDTANVGSDGYLYSGSKKVATEEYVTSAIGAAIAASY